MVNN
ncbi:uncharacterized protein FTOL_09201 [Fusarium torulosum]|jgi:magnesium-transporting ATPase (P-type)